MNLNSRALSLSLLLSLCVAHWSFAQNDETTVNEVHPVPPPAIPRQETHPEEKKVKSGDAKDLDEKTSLIDLDLSKEFRYDPTVGRDPFRPFRVLRPSEVTNEELLDPLTLIDIDKLMVVGIIWEVKSPRAMLKERGSSEKLYTVQINSRVGRNNGVVKAIREGEVVVIEREEIDGQAVHTAKILEINQ